MKKNWQLWLSCILIIVVFFPVLHSGYFPIDDTGMVADVLSKSFSDFKGLFFSESTTGLYYRPITYSSYILDGILFNAHPVWMHSINLFFHLLNSLLVYFCCQQLIELTCQRGSENKQYSLAAMLLFGVHPLTTESVSWISGRTDILACFFILSAISALLKYKSTRHLMWLPFSLGCGFLAVLSKESAIAFAPVFLLFALTGGQKGTRREKLFKVLLCLILALTVLAVFVLMRGVDYAADNSRIGLTLQYIHNNPVHSFWLVMRGIGFYVKKMLFPWPLNFSITDADPLYELLGVPVVIFLLYILLRNSLKSVLFVVGFLLLSPSLVMVFYQIAWTPYAERYVYMTLALILPVIVSSALSIDPQYHRWVRGGLVAFILFYSVTTMQRSFIWADPIRLLSKTAEQSPGALEVNYAYAAELYRRGDLSSALQQLETTSRNSSGGFNEKAEMAIAQIYAEQGEELKYLDKNLEILSKSKGRSLPPIDNLLTVLSDKEGRIEGDQLRRVKSELQEIRSKYNTNALDYAVGALWQLEDCPEKAEEYFSLAIQGAFANPRQSELLHLALKQIRNDD